MKSLAWKLAIVAAVAGVGSLVMLQAQRAMSRSMLAKSTEKQDVDPPQNATSTPVTVAQNDPPAETSGKSPSSDAHQDVPQPLAPTPNAAPTNSEPSTSNNPFADLNDEPHPPAAKDSSKTAAEPQQPVKQTSANLDETSKDAGPTPNAAAPLKSNPQGDSHSAATGADVPQTVPGMSPAQRGTKDPKPGTGQGEPLIPQAEPGVDSKASVDSKATSDSKVGAEGKNAAAGGEAAGPQLLGPGPDARSSSPGSAQPESKSGATDVNSGPAMPAPIDEKKPSKDSGPAIGGPEPPSLPDLDKNEKSPFPTGGDKTPAKTAANAETVASDNPNVFPADSGKDSAPAKMPAANASGAPAPAAILKENRENSSIRSEPGPDFQGDGTVSETSPLGPQRPQLNIEKIAPQNALLGQPLIYSILVKNIGTSAAHDVVVEDRIPKGTKLSGTIPRAEMSGKKLAWHIGNLGSGEQRKISIRVIPLEAGEVGSVATVNFVAEAAAETVVTAPRLEFELSAPKAAKLGETVPFHFRVKNVGTGEARSVVIRDLIPALLSHSAGNDLEYEVGRLPPGKSKELTLDLKAIKVGSAVNRAVAIGDGGLSVEAKADIEIRGSKVALTRSGPSRRYLGRPAVFSNTLVNESKYDVEGVVVVETVPPGMDFLAATHGGQFNENSRTIAWRIDRMAAGETQVVKAKLAPKTPGKQVSTIRVTVPNGEPAETTSTTVAEGFAALAVEVPSVDSPIDAGEKVTFRVNARNKGTIAATNVAVTIDIPEQMVVKSARGPEKYVQEGNRIRFPISTLEGRTAATCEVVLEAQKRGDSRIKVTLQADQIEKPLTREESVLVLSESSEPAAQR